MNSNKKESISLEESLDILVDKLKSTKNENVLYYKSDENSTQMQKALLNFFSLYGSVLTRGSLRGNASILALEEGRESTTNPPVEKLLNSDVVIVWGANINKGSYLFDLIKNKKIVTIDPIKTDIAKQSNIHMQINPKTDHELALLFTRFAHMQDLEDNEFIDEFGSGADWFFDISRNRPVVSYEATTGIPLSQVNDFFDLIENKSVAILIGNGIQRYFESVQIVRCIDSFAAYMGYHKKEGSGVWNLNNPSSGYKNPFEIKEKNKKVSIANVDFSSYELVFIHNSNPLVAAPNTKKVIEGLQKSFVVYFGEILNESCEYADLIIQTTPFSDRKDIKLSYYEKEFKTINEISNKSADTISDYDLTDYLFKNFDFEKLKNEDEIISYYKNTEVEYEELETFNFIEEVEIEPLYKEKNNNNFYLVTSKNKNDSISNPRNNFVYLNSSTNFKESDLVNISSKYGSAEFIVKIDDDIKENCAFFNLENKNLNYLTSDLEDESSFSAMYQEVLVEIELS